MCAWEFGDVKYGSDGIWLPKIKDTRHVLKTENEFYTINKEGEYFSIVSIESLMQIFSFLLRKTDFGTYPIDIGIIFPDPDEEYYAGIWTSFQNNQITVSKVENQGHTKENAEQIFLGKKKYILSKRVWTNYFQRIIYSESLCTLGEVEYRVLLTRHLYTKRDNTSKMRLTISEKSLYNVLYYALKNSELKSINNKRRAIIIPSADKTYFVGILIYIRDGIVTVISMYDKPTKEYRKLSIYRREKKIVLDDYELPSHVEKTSKVSGKILAKIGTLTSYPKNSTSNQWSMIKGVPVEQEKQNRIRIIERKDAVVGNAILIHKFENIKQQNDEKLIETKKKKSTKKEKVLDELKSLLGYHDSLI